MPKKIVDKDILDKRIIGEPQTEFPWDAVPEVLRNYCITLADLNDNDPVAIITPLWATLGVLIGANTWAHCGDGTWYNQPTLQTMYISPSGTRKSPALRLGTMPILALEEKLEEQYQKLLEQWKADMANPELDQNQKALLQKDKPSELTCITGDINYESVVMVLSPSIQSSLLISVDEAHTFFQNLKTGQKDNTGPFNSLWNGRASDSIRKSGITKLKGYVNVCITTGGQPDIIKPILEQPEIRQSGFVQRFLYYCRKGALPRHYREKQHSKEDGEKAREALLETSRRIVSKTFELIEKFKSEKRGRYERMRVLTAKLEANKRLLQFMDAIENDKGYYAECGSKVGDQVVRIALILTIVKNPEIDDGGLIELSEIENAIKIWKFYAHSYNQFFDKQDEYEEMETKIVNQFKNGFKKNNRYEVLADWQIWNDLNPRIKKYGKDVFYVSLDNACKHGYIRETENPNPKAQSKPGTRFFVLCNPTLE